MTLNNKVNNFVNKILNLLKPMGKITICKDKNSQYLLKDQIIFAEINQDKIFFRSPNIRAYVVAPKNTIQNRDLLLVQATKSYFIAKEENEKYLNYM